MNTKYVIISFVLVGVILGGFYIKTKSTSMAGERPFSDQLRVITILVPENVQEYTKAMDEYVSVGGTNPANNWDFVEKKIDATFDASFNIIRESAELAARQIGTGGGPEHASISYLRIRGGVAYVVLNIDLDGWTGVSFSIAKIHPLVERTLLQFKEIKSVIFGFAPGDSFDTI